MSACDPKPEWATMFSGEDWPTFLEILETEIGRSIPGSKIHLQSGFAERNKQQFGFANVAARCSQSPEESWGPIVSEHFARLGAAATNLSPQLDAKRLSAMLKVRIYPNKGYNESTRGPKWPVADDMFACLVVDLPEMVKSLAEEELAILAMEPDAAFSLALENVWSEEKVERMQLKRDDNVIDALSGSGLFTTTHLFLLDRYLDEPQFGAFVAVPNRHHLFFHQIRDKRSFEVGGTMAELAAVAYEQGPGSLSPELYWWDDGRLVALNDEDPPEDFLLHVIRPLAK
ncbi:MAG: hypothetical protein ACHQ50_00730 [Fimbriimonadales bacterium]